MDFEVRVISRKNTDHAIDGPEWVGRHYGMGFVVGFDATSRYIQIVTCAHVVASAIAEGNKARAREIAQNVDPPDTGGIVVLLTRNYRDGYEATLVNNLWFPEVNDRDTWPPRAERDQPQDIAVLEVKLPEDAPELARIAPIEARLLKDPDNTPFKAYGYKDYDDAGRPAFGEVTSPVSGGWWSTTVERRESDSLAAGFSGGAVCAKDDGRLLGMVVAGRPREPDVGYVIPASTLAEATGLIAVAESAEVEAHDELIALLRKYTFDDDARTLFHDVKTAPNGTAQSFSVAVARLADMSPVGSVDPLADFLVGLTKFNVEKDGRNQRLSAWIQQVYGNRTYEDLSDRFARKIRQEERLQILLPEDLSLPEEFREDTDPRVRVRLHTPNKATVADTDLHMSIPVELDPDSCLDAVLKAVRHFMSTLRRTLKVEVFLPAAWIVEVMPDCASFQVSREREPTPLGMLHPVAIRVLERAVQSDGGQAKDFYENWRERSFRASNLDTELPSYLIGATEPDLALELGGPIEDGLATFEECPTSLSPEKFSERLQCALKGGLDFAIWRRPMLNEKPPETAFNTAVQMLTQAGVAKAPDVVRRVRTEIDVAFLWDDPRKPYREEGLVSLEERLE